MTKNEKDELDFFGVKQFRKNKEYQDSEQTDQDIEIIMNLSKFTNSKRKKSRSGRITRPSNFHIKELDDESFEKIVKKSKTMTV